jgi:sugar (pentulose or hexulose) kinase
MLAEFDGSSVKMEEFIRFHNQPVRTCTGYYWDVLAIITHIKEALSSARGKGCPVSGLGVDCFGVDFGLLSPSGDLLANPVCDIDPRTNGIIEQTGVMSIEELYMQTGAQIYDMTTLFQLVALIKENSAALKGASRLLFMPDLINYLLTGVMRTEFTVASTSLLVKPTERAWNHELMRAYGINPALFGDIELPGASAPLCGLIRDELLMPDIQVTTIAGHDTASAVIPIPARSGESYAWVSSGTWSVIGAPTEKPIIDMRFAGVISNEGCYDGGNRLIKNAFGMKFINELRHVWNMEGRQISFADMDAAAEAALPFASFIDPENFSFFAGDHMPHLIRQYCMETGQSIPESAGEFVRAVDESLAFCYKKALAEMETITGRKLETLYIVGGGTQNRILCQMAANACGIPVIAGAKESAALGNAMIQLKASGELRTAGEMADCVSRSVERTVYEPQDVALWQENYPKYLEAIKRYHA